MNKFLFSLGQAVSYSLSWHQGEGYIAGIGVSTGQINYWVSVHKLYLSNWKSSNIREYPEVKDIYCINVLDLWSKQMKFLFLPEYSLLAAKTAVRL